MPGAADGALKVLSNVPLLLVYIDTYGSVYCCVPSLFVSKYTYPLKLGGNRVPDTVIVVNGPPFVGEAFILAAVGVILNMAGAAFKESQLAWNNTL
ncbi:hypothetical protein D3C84_1020970 [compost metagenome]